MLRSAEKNVVCVRVLRPLLVGEQGWCISKTGHVRFKCLTLRSNQDKQANESDPASFSTLFPIAATGFAFAEIPSEQALVTTFNVLLQKGIVGKAAFASWYKAKHDGGRSQHPIMQDFFKKRVLT